MTSNDPRKWYFESGAGRYDKNDVEWFTCDPYPTWYRWEGDKLIKPHRDTFPGWRDE